MSILSLYAGICKIVIFLVGIGFMWPAWIVVGAILEERDLVDAFGEDHRKYQEKVPMLLPRRFLKRTQ